MKTPAWARNRLDPAVKNRRVINALQVVLERVTLDADTTDADALEDAEALLRGLDELMAPARAARAQEKARIRRENGAVRERENLAAEAERAKILGEAPSNAVLLDELNQARAAGDIDRARILERAILGIEDAAPSLIDPDQKARDKQAALDKRERERAGMLPPAKPEPRKLDADTQRAIERMREVNRANRAGKAKASAALATSTEAEE